MPSTELKTPSKTFFYIQVISTIVFCIAAVYTLIQIQTHSSTELTLLTLGLQIIGAFLLALAVADFSSGIVHFIFDNFGNEKTPFFGINFIKPFRDHHDDPQEITRHTFFDTNGSNFLAVAPLMMILLLWLSSQPEKGEINIFGSLFIWFFLIAISLTNQFHKWAHAIKRPKIIQALQGMHLILPFKHHTVHHSFHYDKYYCITTGWLNPLLTKIGFFEWILKMFNHQPSVEKG